MSNFASILDAAPTEIVRPKSLPVGSYLCVINGLPRYDQSSKKKTDFVEFQLKPLSAGDDVDQDDLNIWMQKEDGTTRTLADASIKATYYLTETAAYRLDEFHEHCGLELDPNVSRRQRNEMATGCQVMAFVKHRASDDGKNVFAELGSTAPAE